MFTSSISYLNSMLYDTTKGTRGSKGTNLIYRDELSKKTSPKKIKKGGNCLASKEEDEGENFEKRGDASSVQEKDVTRVKVRMTKEEAARLMAKCKEGGLLEFKDVAHELVQLPANRVSVVSSNGGYGGLLRSPSLAQFKLNQAKCEYLKAHISLSIAEPRSYRWFKDTAEWLTRTSETNISDSRKMSNGRRPEWFCNLTSTDGRTFESAIQFSKTHGLTLAAMAQKDTIPIQVPTNYSVAELSMFEPNHEDPLNQGAAAVSRDNPKLFESNVRKAMAGGVNKQSSAADLTTRSSL
ncbi:hypothetical protein POTOM_015881 [Populus tomentosa]|uniref:DUF7890 domain-containing protein n=1 Tax=Populus tomentosa TaxID=118781 RepID=A0A8X8D8I1_POPTO|nr:hypothetical protein POTOM_015881 [Populus tomentosa]